MRQWKLRDLCQPVAIASFGQPLVSLSMDITQSRGFPALKLIPYNIVPIA